MPQTTEREFVEWLVETIETRDWTYRQTADRFGVTQTAIVNYLNGTALPGADIQEHIAEATGAGLELIQRMVWDADKQRRLDRKARAEERAARRRARRTKPGA